MLADLETGRRAATVMMSCTDALCDRPRRRYVLSGARGGAWSLSFERVRDALRASATAAGAESFVPPLLRVEGEVVAGGHPESVWGVAAAPDGRWFATSGYHGAACLWDATSLEQAGTVGTFGTLAWTVALGPDGRLAVGAGSVVELFTVPDGKPVGHLRGHEELVTSISFHPTAPCIATSSQDGTVRMWDAQRFTALGSIRTAARVSEVEFDPRGRYLAAACDDGSVLLFDADASSLQGYDDAQPVSRWDGHETALWTLAYDREGGLLASGSEDGRILLRDAETGAMRLALLGSPRLRSLSFSDDGRYLAAGCWSARSTTWDLVKLREVIEGLGLGWPWPARPAQPIAPHGRQPTRAVAGGYASGSSAPGGRRRRATSCMSSARSCSSTISTPSRHSSTSSSVTTPWNCPY
jgi:WD40 repeat protein